MKSETRVSFTRASTFEPFLSYPHTEETDSNADRYRESDRSSNLSDVKADIRAGSSVSNAESVTALDSEGEGSTRGVNALALAGPVPNPLGYRYSADYTEPSFPPKNNVSNLTPVSCVRMCVCVSLRTRLFDVSM